MTATITDSRLEYAEVIYTSLVYRNGCFVVMDPSRIRCRVLMPAALVKRQAKGFLSEIDQHRAELLHYAKTEGHTPPRWMTDYAFSKTLPLISDEDADEALCAAADNLGVRPEDIMSVLGEYGYHAIMVL